MSESDWITLLSGAFALVQFLAWLTGIIPARLRLPIVHTISWFSGAAFAVVLLLHFKYVGTWQWIALAALLTPAVFAEIANWIRLGPERHFAAAEEAAPVIVSLLDEIDQDSRIKAESAERIRGLTREVMKVLQSVTPSTARAQSAQVREQVDAILQLASPSVAGTALKSVLDAVAARSIGPEWNHRANVGVEFDLGHLSMQAQWANRTVYTVITAVRDDPALGEAQKDEVIERISRIYRILAGSRRSALSVNDCSDLSGAMTELDALGSRAHSVRTLATAMSEFLSEIEGWQP